MNYRSKIEPNDFKWNERIKPIPLDALDRYLYCLPVNQPHRTAAIMRGVLSDKYTLAELKEFMSELKAFINEDRGRKWGFYIEFSNDYTQYKKVNYCSTMLDFRPADNPFTLADFQAINPLYNVKKESHQTEREKAGTVNVPNVGKRVVRFKKTGGKRPTNNA